MLILNLTKSAAGQYPAIQVYGGPEVPAGYAWWPDSLEQATFEQYEGFIIPTIKRNTVASYEANKEAYEEWKQHKPEPEPEPEPTPGPDMADYATWSEMEAAIRGGVNSVT